MISRQRVATEFNELVNDWPEQHRIRLDCLVASHFCQMKMLGMLSDFPEIVTQLSETQLGILRFIVWQLDVAASSTPTVITALPNESNGSQ